MSVRNIGQIPQTRGMLVATAKKVRERAEAAKAASLELDKAETDVRIGAAAVLQSIDDEREPLDEEIGQLQGILDSVKKATATAVVNPEPAPEPVAPVAADPEPAPATPATAVVNPEPAPEPVAPVAADPEPARFLDIWRVASIWERLVIILVAVVGAVIFLLVGKATAGIIRWGTSEWWSWLSAITVFIWYAGLIVGGFGLGGWLAARWFARRR